MYLRVRRAVMVEGMSIREAAREFELHRVPVRKILTYYPPRSATRFWGYHLGPFQFFRNLTCELSGLICFRRL